MFNTVGDTPAHSSRVRVHRTAHVHRTDDACVVRCVTLQPTDDEVYYYIRCSQLSDAELAEAIECLRLKPLTKAESLQAAKELGLSGPQS